MADPVTKYFDKVQLLDGSIAEVRDSVAREAIAGGTHFLGITSTALIDGSTTNPITVNEETVTASNGDIVVSGNKEFIFATADNKWHELGDTTGLGALALKDSVSATYTPAGTISKPGVTVTPTPVTVKEIDAAGEVNTGTIKEINDAGSVTAGTANTPTAVVLPVLTTTLNGTTLEIGWTEGSVTPGVAGVPTAVTLPTTKNTTVVTSATMPTTKNTNVLSSVSAELDATPAFTGTQATIVSE